ncbi:type II toxin-antitoxin system RelE/ParE family toxin [Streptomyces sp. NPDC002994]|uniref:type II toxin-antitoxin system RelE/ParE family toxin n=1 Tax=Streptomyces sp. NPDC002994 TaxID=3154441 RepID=UPI0033AA7D56
MGVAWEIVLLEPVNEWFLTLAESDPETAVLVERAIDRLATIGPGLGRPLVDTLTGSSLSNLKELRPGSRGRSELRLLFVFDPDREAVFLVAGDKAGRWSQWYPESIALAEKRYAAYREEKQAEQERPSKGDKR